MTTEDVIQKLVAKAAHAVSIFTKLYASGGAMFGRVPGGCVIDCIKSDYRVMLVTTEQRPGVVCLAIANKKSEENPRIVSETPIVDLTSEDILNVMRQHFALS